MVGVALGRKRTEDSDSRAGACANRRARTGSDRTADGRADHGAAPDDSRTTPADAGAGDTDQLRMNRCLTAIDQRQLRELDSELSGAFKVAASNT